MGRTQFTVLGICIVGLSYTLYVSIRADLAAGSIAIQGVAPDSPAVLTQPDHKAPPPKDWKVVDAQVTWEFSQGQYKNLTITGTNGKPLAVIHRDTGKVTLYGNPNDAARVFWEAVGFESSRICELGH